MKKAFLCLMTLCLVLCLTYCSAPAHNPPTIPDSSLTTLPEDTSALTQEAIETPAPDETVVPFADPDDVFYFANALEAGRIYRQGLDGSGLVLICDVEALSIKEMGDVLFAAVSVARKAGVDAEKALKESVDRFAARFTLAEGYALADGKAVSSLSAKEWDDYYRRAKATLKGE